MGNRGRRKETRERKKSSTKRKTKLRDERGQRKVRGTDDDINMNEN